MKIVTVEKALEALKAAGFDANYEYRIVAGNNFRNIIFEKYGVSASLPVLRIAGQYAVYSPRFKRLESNKDLASQVAGFVGAV